MNEASYDIAVIGAGPAGSATAIGLSRLGYRVVLIHQPRRRLSIEGISHHTLSALQQLHCHHAVDAAGEQVARHIVWNGEETSRNREFVLNRPRFDAALLEDAIAAGVTLIAGKMVKNHRDSDHWTLKIEQEGGRQAQRARFFVEARGRGAPAHGSRASLGPAALAMSRPWRLPPNSSASHLATFAQGWGWYICDAEGNAVLQIMTAAKLKDETQTQGLSLQQRYDQLLNGFSAARNWIRQGTPAGEVSACGAGMTLHSDLVQENYLRVGDAALAPDPLSGHGIFESLSGAMTAIAVIHTLRQKPERLQLAADFYRRRIEQRYGQLARVGRDFYQQETHWPQQRFWQQRRDWPDLEPAHPEPLSKPARIETRPVILEGMIDSQPVVVTADQPLGVWQVNGVPLVPLLELLKSKKITPETAAQQLQCPLQEVKQAYAWLRQYRLT